MTNGIWALHEEGEDLVMFSGISEGFGLTIPESGGPIAVKTATTFTSKPATSGLHLIDFPSAEVSDYPEVLILKPVVWSHDGSRLAVIQRKPDSYSLFSLSIIDGEMLTLLEGLDDISAIFWSHDDKRILVGGKTRPGGRKQSDFTYWNVSTDGSGVEVIYQQHILGSAPRGGVTLGWISDSEFISDVYDWRCRFSDLKKIDFDTGEVVSLWADNYSDRAIDTESGTILVSISDERDPNFALNHDPGLYFVSAVDGNIKKISEDFSNCGYWWSMAWSTEANRFFVLSRDSLLAVSLDGEISRFQTPFPPALLVSPSGLRWAITSQMDDPGLWIGTPSEPPKEISSELVVDPIWSRDSESIYFFVKKETKLADLYVAWAPAFEPELIGSELPYMSHKAEPIWVTANPSIATVPLEPEWPAPMPRSPTTHQASLVPAEIAQVYFFDKLHGWLLGKNNRRIVIGITADGGRTWEGSPGPDALIAEMREVYSTDDEIAPPRAVRWLHFISPQDGWAFGPSLFATNDGGESWIDISPSGNVVSLATSNGVTRALERVSCSEGVQYMDPIECRYLLHELSPGGGISHSLEIPKEFYGGSLHPINTDTLWIQATIEEEFVSEPLLLLTTDGGLNWVETSLDCPIGASRVYGFAIAEDDQLLFACGDYGTGALGQKMVYLSTDGGGSWELVGDVRLDSDPRNDDLSISGYLGGIGAASDKNAWMTLGRSWPLISRDGGRSWTHMDFAPLDDGFISVFFVNDLHGWATHRASVYLSDDSGKTWRLVITGDESIARITSVVAIDNLNVWVLGHTHWEGDVLFNTGDGGKRWQCHSLPEFDECDLGNIWQVVRP